MIEQSLYCVLGKQKKWLLCHKQGRTCIRALCVTLSFTRVTPMWSHTCFLLVIHLNNHLIFKVKEARKETDFLGYRGMKTSSSTQLLSRPITASMNVCVGHKYTLSTQTYCLLYIYMYFMQMFFFMCETFQHDSLHYEACVQQHIVSTSPTLVCIPPFSLLECRFSYHVLFVRH